MHYFSKFILFTVFRWRIVGVFPKNIKKYIVIGAPHTSWLDFPLGILLRSITKTNIHFVGKKALFKYPQGIFFRWAGGFPVDRSRSNNTVEALADKFKQEDQFILGISPEGTRKKAEKWKTGFYYIAKLAEIPIVKVAFDFKHKQIIIDTAFYPTDNTEQDLSNLKSFYKGIQGRHAELS